jgi:hypothetical protein
MAGMGLMQVLVPFVIANVSDIDRPEFYAFIAPIGITISIVLTILAIVGIWEKDNPKYFGLGSDVQEKTKISEYIQIIKENKPMQRLMIAGAGCKLALSVATVYNVLCMLYGSMMGDFNEFVEVEPKPKKNGWAIASLVCGIVSLCCCNPMYMVSLAAVITGIVGLMGNKGSKGMAITGIVLGGVAVLVGIVLDILLLPFTFGTSFFV